MQSPCGHKPSLWSIHQSWFNWKRLSSSIHKHYIVNTCTHDYGLLLNDNDATRPSDGRFPPLQYCQEQMRTKGSSNYVLVCTRQHHLAYKLLVRTNHCISTCATITISVNFQQHVVQLQQDDQHSQSYTSHSSLHQRHIRVYVITLYRTQWN